MIKFFRKIRKNLLNESKATRYFKFAIGEIFLAVIGILIAENLAPTLKLARWSCRCFKYTIGEDELVVR